MSSSNSNANNNQNLFEEKLKQAKKNVSDYLAQNNKDIEFVNKIKDTSGAITSNFHSRTKEIKLDSELDNLKKGPKGLELDLQINKGNKLAEEQLKTFNVYSDDLRDAASSGDNIVDKNVNKMQSDF